MNRIGIKGSGGKPMERSRALRVDRVSQRQWLGRLLGAGARSAAKASQTQRNNTKGICPQSNS